MTVDGSAQTRDELDAELQRLHNQVRQLRAEQRLLACEIHDGLVQDAVGAHMRLQRLLEVDQLPPGSARDQVQQAAALMAETIAEARRLIAGLRPPVLDKLGLVPAVQHLVNGEQADGPSIHFTSKVEFDRLEPLLEATIYRIVQEAISNAKRHSGSDRVEVRLTQADDRLHVEIQDWGVGFNPRSVPENRFGLQGISERARLLRGRASVESAPGKGTRVFVDLPVAQALQKCN